MLFEERTCERPFSCCLTEHRVALRAKDAAPVSIAMAHCEMKLRTSADGPSEEEHSGNCATAQKDGPSIEAFHVGHITEPS